MASRNPIRLKTLITEDHTIFGIDFLQTIEKTLKQIGLILSPNKSRYIARVISADPKVRSLKNSFNKLHQQLEAELIEKYNKDPEFKNIVNAVKRGELDLHYGNTMDSEEAFSDISNKMLKNNAIDALVKLGYKRSKVIDAINNVNDGSKYMTSEDTIKAALKYLNNK